MKILRFEKEIKMDALLDCHKDVYSIESAFDKLNYCVGRKNENDSSLHFAVMRLDGAIMCSIEEMPELANMMVEPVAEEIRALYEDFKDLVRMESRFVT